MSKNHENDYNKSLESHNLGIFNFSLKNLKSNIKDFEQNSQFFNYYKYPPQIPIELVNV